tara:strand:- start:4 stop:477 length:474 start_codon:yes stop_codon:yes gene_type:complete
MAKLSASVQILEEGTVASLISLCMAPPPSHPGSPKSGSSKGGKKDTAQDGSVGLEDLIPVDPSVLPAPPKAMHFDHLVHKRSKEMHEPRNSSDEEKLPVIVPVNWKKQSIKVNGVAPDAPVSGAATGGQGSLEGEALAIEANLVEPSSTEDDEDGGK